MRHSFKDITIKNFRRVDLLEINGFAKINLFVGANNVGKTSILEAYALTFPHCLNRQPDYLWLQIKNGVRNE